MEIYRRYHWAILVRPKDIRRIAESTSFDVTDGIRLEGGQAGNLNPNQEWWFRARTPVNPLGTGHFLVAVIIGKLPQGVTVDDVRTLLLDVPLPCKGVIPEQRCSFRTSRAIARLQQAGYVKHGDVEKIMGTVLKAGDKVCKEGPPKRVEDRFLDL